MPAGPGIELPAGPVPVLAPLPPALAEPPGFYLVPGKLTAGLSLLVPQSVAGPVTRLVLAERSARLGPGARGRLSGQATEPISADLYHPWHAADAPAEAAPEVADSTLAALEDLAETGATAVELAPQNAVMRHRLREARPARESSSAGRRSAS